MQFVPLDAQKEVNLPEPLRNVLSFAKQKLREVKMLSEADNQSFCDEIEAQWQIFKAFSPYSQTVAHKLTNLKTNDFDRTLSYLERLEKQLPLPMLPTTTIGSFPQTSEVRQLRVKYKRGELTQQQYEDAIDDHIAECIKLQEDIGLDVLVHGEFERTDMVEYFGQQLSGFAFTEHGWVQSYGSRYVRPPIIFSDVARPEPISTAIANPATQIHTHMCYSEFGDIIKDIERLDADVISIENSRSNNRTLEEVTEAGYSHQIGNDVYDIHSPVVPSTEQMVQQLQEGISNLPLKQIWVNPDCGLKTRRWEEVIPALKNMVEATKIIREKAQSL